MLLAQVLWDGSRLLRELPALRVLENTEETWLDTLEAARQDSCCLTFFLEPDDSAAEALLDKVVQACGRCVSPA